MSEKYCLRPGWSRAALLTVMAGLVFTASVSGQSNTNNVADTRGYSTLDFTIFGGYQWFQFGQGSNAAIHRFDGAGAWGARLSEELSRYFAIEEGYQMSFNRLELLPVGATNLSSMSDMQNRVYAAGVLNLAPREAKFRPFVKIGPEYIWYLEPGFGSIDVAPGSPAIVAPLAGTTHGTGRTALAYGIGLKINASRRWALRFDVEGMRSGTPHFGLPTIPGGPGTLYIPGGDSHESSLTASVGLTFRMRYHEPPAPPAPAPPPPPPPPPALQVGAITGARDVCGGEDVRLSVTASGGPPNGTMNYQWIVNGNPVAGATGSSFNVPTADGQTKTVTVRVSVGDASATANPVTININPLAPPTILFTISPSTVPYGTKINLAPNATGSSCGGPVTVTCSGQGVTGMVFDSTALTFDMSNRLKQQSQTVTLTCTATDQKNQTASATAPVTVTLTTQAKRLDDIVFPLNSSRVNNCAKRLLIEELTPMLRADPDAKVVLIGHRDERERVVKGKTPVQVDEARVLNSAAVLSAGKGICPQLDLSRVQVNWVGTDQASDTHPALCGTSTNIKERGGQSVRESDTRAQYRRVEIWFIPGGADMPSNLTGLQPAPAAAIQAKGCPK
ncbi:MAG TPA: hypothetical protein VKB79_03075 [Bryobacteraceae bacterium]|nr:hypothetical protein [Bryobacteraceae bacterium]